MHIRALGLQTRIICIVLAIVARVLFLPSYLDGELSEQAFENGLRDQTVSLAQEPAAGIAVQQITGAPDGEVMIDLQVAGALAPAAQLVVYFAPNTDRGFLDAIKTAIHDHQNRPSILSIGWGGPEASWTAQALRVHDQAFQEAAALGITVCCAAGDADPATGYLIRVDHREVVLGGTSAVAPLWAALIALINQQLGRPVGYLNPPLYSGQIASSGAPHDITRGNNGSYRARQGWDACTGLGTPNGAKLLQAITGRSQAVTR